MKNDNCSPLCPCDNKNDSDFRACTCGTLIAEEDCCITPFQGAVRYEFPLATAFVQPQVYRGGMSGRDSLNFGTFFPELLSPFMDGR